mmetsp:Transcript_7898/g.15871  ORF Transcript_7898/g.15871 Transcript_7898/m.15871 type:complete len:151 (-) Transcript_7898:479-931(-)
MMRSLSSVPHRRFGTTESNTIRGIHVKFLGYVFLHLSSSPITAISMLSCANPVLQSILLRGDKTNFPLCRLTLLDLCRHWFNEASPLEGVKAIPNDVVSWPNPTERSSRVLSEEHCRILRWKQSSTHATYFGGASQLCLLLPYCYRIAPL